MGPCAVLLLVSIVTNSSMQKGFALLHDVLELAMPYDQACGIMLPQRHSIRKRLPLRRSILPIELNAVATKAIALHDSSLSDEGIYFLEKAR